VKRDIVIIPSIDMTTNIASEEAWRQSEVVEAKEWFTAKDERVCEFCGPMNGKTVGLGRDTSTRATSTKAVTAGS
jgi:hypothetical protein